MFTVAFWITGYREPTGLPSRFPALPGKRVCSGHTNRQWVLDNSQGNKPENKYGISIKGEAFCSTKQLSQSSLGESKSQASPLSQRVAIPVFCFTVSERSVVWECPLSVSHRDGCWSVNRNSQWSNANDVVFYKRESLHPWLWTFIIYPETPPF